ncbi:zinc ribbon domain-containing protein [Aureibacillus halotolerans]|uniref:Zinc-ribbon domain-containing protein n=1 Tax=Aureibacillus halotolerans TaxID=1508390 RepID=A0A4R6UD79_9BACI|nr:zinc ribbon domain-containing protein [Aureibacillus halotolerans]TDQ42735.1 hypothetical protein EV213_101164 [Aureibacillus halotolerans]
MICPYCGQENEEHAAACSRCGRSLQIQEEGEMNETNEPTQQQTVSTPSPAQKAPGKSDQYIAVAKKSASNYGQFLSRVFKAPLTTAQSSTSADMVNGIISLALLCLLFAVTIAVSFADFDAGFVDGFLKPLLNIILFCGLGLLGVWVVAILQNAAPSFQETVAKLGTLSTISAALVLLSMITLLFDNGSLFYTLMFFSMLTFMIASSFVLVSFKSTSSPRIDYFYGILLVVLFEFVIFNQLISGYISGSELLNSFY